MMSLGFRGLSTHGKAAVVLCRCAKQKSAKGAFATPTITTTVRVDNAIVSYAAASLFLVAFALVLWSVSSSRLQRSRSSHNINY